MFIKDSTQTSAVGIMSHIFRDNEVILLAELLKELPQLNSKRHVQTLQNLKNSKFSAKQEK
jgi:hypothetical protein